MISGLKVYVELKDLVDFIKSKDPQTYVTSQGGGQDQILPFKKKIKITVNKENCLKYGIVPEYFKDKMVDSITFNIKIKHSVQERYHDPRHDRYDQLETAGLFFAAPGSVRNFPRHWNSICYMEGLGV